MKLLTINAYLIFLQIRELQEKLLATENTVRLLSKKNKTYLSALQAAGVPMTLLNRSSSENCLASVTESLGNRASSVVNLSTWTDGESSKLPAYESVGLYLMKK